MPFVILLELDGSFKRLSDVSSFFVSSRPMAWLAFASMYVPKSLSRPSPRRRQPLTDRRQEIAAHDSSPEPKTCQ
jgi:hypothetical protein